MSASPGRILLVEDDVAMRRFLRASLGSTFELLEALTGAEAVQRAAEYNPELILLDLGLPDMDGLEVTRQIRGWSQTPIIVLSARGREGDKVAALDAGADDYLTKPFGVNELLARIRAALRRAPGTAGTEAVVQFGPLQLDFARRVVTLSGAELHLTPIEYRLLTLLAQNAGRVLTHKQLLEQVWGPDHGDRTHYLRVYMAQLRRKVEADPARPSLLVTEPGVGYRLKVTE